MSDWEKKYKERQQQERKELIYWVVGILSFGGLFVFGLVTSTAMITDRATRPQQVYCAEHPRECVGLVYFVPYHFEIRQVLKTGVFNQNVQIGSTGREGE